MGDRSFCELELRGPILSKVYEDFLTLIEDDLTDEPAPGQFLFEEMNYGEMPLGLEEFLVQNKISFYWWNDAGGDYPAEYHLYDGVQGKHAQFLGSDEIILMSVGDAQRPDILQSASDWQDWLYDVTKFEVIK